MSIEKAAKFWGIIAFVAAIGFSTAGCDNPTNPTHTHEWGAWRQTRAPTCTTAGEETRTCTLDATHIDIQAIPINPNAHNWNSEKEVIPATITDDGKKAITCKYNRAHTRDEESTGEYATGTPGLEFGLFAASPSGNPDVIVYGSYSVRKGTVTSGTVHIPAYHRPDANSQYWPVTEIGYYDDFNGAFENTNITAVTFAKNSQLEYINVNAFKNCTRLTSIEIPADVREIYSGTFSGCTSLTNVTFAVGSQLEIIGVRRYEEGIYDPSGAFSGCSSLTCITIPVGVTIIDWRAFENCTSLTNVTFAKNSQLEFIGYNAFKNCTRLTNITIPASVTSVSDGAFSGWKNTQTIYIEGHASEAATDAAWWGADWRSNCNAVIKYWNGTTWM